MSCSGDSWSHGRAEADLFLHEGLQKQTGEERDCSPVPCSLSQAPEPLVMPPLLPTFTHTRLNQVALTAL